MYSQRRDVRTLLHSVEALLLPAVKIIGEGYGAEVEAQIRSLPTPRLQGRKRELREDRTIRL